MRLPSWAYVRLEWLYIDQRSMRRKASAEQVDRDDQALRDWADQTREAHRAGTCGGREAGCVFVPCIPPVS
jgi:hypothetical protein